MLELREKSLHFDEYKLVIKSLIGHHWDDAIYELNLVDGFESIASNDDG